MRVYVAAAEDDRTPPARRSAPVLGRSGVECREALAITCAVVRVYVAVAEDDRTPPARRSAPVLGRSGVERREALVVSCALVRADTAAAGTAALQRPHAAASPYRLIRVSD
ncbi:hypothetical protein LBMAG56_19110 [Verrucomicrobiota bacterium]|nr:hypothetical protein LBMAG56_19110 [Verrucomicrobiota bacterium]